MELKAWAVVIKGELREGETGIPYTNVDEMLGGGCVYQIYRIKRDADAFCRDIKFFGAEYEVKACTVTL